MRTDSLYCSPLRLKMPYIFKTAGDRQDRVLTDEVTIQRIMAIRAMFIVLQAMKKHLTNGNLTDPVYDPDEQVDLTALDDNAYFRQAILTCAKVKSVQ